MSLQRQLIVVANRLPVRNVSDRDGQRWVTSPGGLVSALAPVMTSRPNASWIGWSGSAGRAPDPFVHDDISLYPVELTRADVQLYYEGFSNGTLWPLYHDAIGEPEYHRTWWDAYLKINRRFADSVIEIADPEATVWIHDYQLQLVPGHAPSGETRSADRVLPAHTVAGSGAVLASAVARTDRARSARLVADRSPDRGHGCQLPSHRAPDDRRGRGRRRDGHHRWTVDNLQTPPDRHRLRPVRRSAATAPETAAAVEALRDQLGHPRTVLLGVDRLDYTKGIAQRLRAFGELLDEERISADDTVLIQIAEPSRGNVLGYADIRAEVEQLVGEINGKFGTMTGPVVHYLHRSHDFAELIALYRLADVMLVTPFRDGMNLVAKEYVATRYDDTGVLVLSEFAGAVNELEQAVQVNPYDTDGMKAAIESAVRMRSHEQTERMSAMRSVVAESTAHTWASTFVAELDGE